MTPAQILRLNFGREQLSVDDGEFVSDLEAARSRHILGQEQPTRETPIPISAPVEPHWNDADVESPVLVSTLEVEFVE